MAQLHHTSHSPTSDAVLCLLLAAKSLVVGPYQPDPAHPLQSSLLQARLARLELLARIYVTLAIISGNDLQQRRDFARIAHHYYIQVYSILQRGPRRFFMRSSLGWMFNCFV
jgi:hypothetical protein